MRDKIYDTIKDNIVQTYNGVDYKIASENATNLVLKIVEENMKGVLALFDKTFDYIEEKGKLNDEQNEIKAKGIDHLERIIIILCK